MEAAAKPAVETGVAAEARARNHEVRSDLVDLGLQVFKLIVQDFAARSGVAIGGMVVVWVVRTEEGSVVADRVVATEEVAPEGGRRWGRRWRWGWRRWRRRRRAAEAKAAVATVAVGSEEGEKEAVVRAAAATVVVATAAGAMVEAVMVVVGTVVAGMVAEARVAEASVGAATAEVSAEAEKEVYDGGGG